MTFDASATEQRDFWGYLMEPIPSPLDRAVERAVPQLQLMPSHRYSKGDFSESARDVLLAYAERAAIRAVREGETSHLLRATIAASLGGLIEESRDAQMTMAFIEDAAGRIGAELSEVFREASEIVGHPSAMALIRWLMREPSTRTLGAMGHEAAQDADGFTYRRRAKSDGFRRPLD